MLPRWPQADHWPSLSLLWCLREYVLRQVSAQTQWWYFGLPPLVPALHSDSGVHISQPGLQLRVERRLWRFSFLGQENNFYPTYFLFCCPRKPLPSFMTGSDSSVFLVSAEELATSCSTLAQCDRQSMVILHTPKVTRVEVSSFRATIPSPWFGTP